MKREFGIGKWDAQTEQFLGWVEKECFSSVRHAQVRARLLQTWAKAHKTGHDYIPMRRKRWAIDAISATTKKPRT